MTVSELIRALESLDPDMEVKSEQENGYSTVDTVFETKYATRDNFVVLNE